MLRQNGRGMQILCKSAWYELGYFSGLNNIHPFQNITAFLMNQNKQFEDAITGMNYARESLDPARLV